MYVKCRNSGRLPKAFCKKDGNLFNCTILLISAHRSKSYVLGKRAPWRKFLGLVPSTNSFVLGDRYDTLETSEPIL